MEFMKKAQLIQQEQINKILKHLKNNINFDIVYPEEIIYRNKYFFRLNNFQWFFYELFRITSEFYINKSLLKAAKEYKKVKHLQSERVSSVYRYYNAFIPLIEDALLFNKERIFSMYTDIINELLKNIQNIAGHQYSYNDLLNYFKKAIMYFNKNIKQIYQQEINERTYKK